jgi:hypothetical protein
MKSSTSAFLFCRRRARALSLVAVAAVSSGCIVGVNTHAHTEREEKRFDVSGTPDLTFVTFDGAIEVRTWDKPQVVVEIEKRGSRPEVLESIDIKAEQDGRRIRVEARIPDEHRHLFGFHMSRSARLVASVPKRANLLARTGDGSVSVEGLQGRLEMRSGDGSIRGFDLTGDVTVHTGDGSVKLESIDGALDASTGDGGVTVSGRLDDLRVHTGDGSVAVRVEKGSKVRDDWEVTTGDGGVVVYLPEKFDADLDASTGDGAVVADRDLSIDSGDYDVEAPSSREARESRRERKRSIRARLGAGGGTVKVRSGDGSISLRAS